MWWYYSPNLAGMYGDSFKHLSFLYCFHAWILSFSWIICLSCQIFSFFGVGFPWKPCCMMLIIMFGKFANFYLGSNFNFSKSFLLFDEILVKGVFIRILIPYINHTSLISIPLKYISNPLLFFHFFVT